MINFFKYHTNPMELYGYDVPYMFVEKRGTKQWYLNGKIHRVDGPAIEWTDGTKQWYLNGKIHRVDGPAIEWADGRNQWWLNGGICTFEDWKEKRKKYL